MAIHFEYISIFLAAAIAYIAYKTNSFGMITKRILASLRSKGASTREGVSAMNCCPPNSKNCIRTTWKAPPDAKNVPATMLDILSSYPQEGQADVDQGGWTIAAGDLKTTGKTRVEYKSGIGIFARIINGGKPFVDDLEVEVTDNVIEMRSASRIGISDLGVNQKRLQFLASKARALGWEAPEPKYGSSD